MTTTQLSYTGAVQTFVVPDGVTSIALDLYGAQGGGAQGGLGGRLQRTITVTPGESLYVYVGGQGTAPGGTGTAFIPGGFNGGGRGAPGGASGEYINGGSGGGGTDVRQGGTALSNRVATAGGGAGASSDRAGAPGGASVATSGESNDGTSHGKGGTQDAGGSGGYGVYGTAGNGSLGVGGDGDDPSGGGGGGGFYGGGGASGPFAGAGGASNQGFSDGTLVIGQRSGNGLAVLTYNLPPTAPTVSYPNGGEVLGAQTYTIDWTDGSAPEGGAVYDVELTRDNGATWTRLVTGLVGSSYAYDFTNVSPSTTCRVRVRLRDAAGQTTAWDESNTNFEVYHNKAPLAPTNLAPSGGVSLDRAVSQQFSWKHNDPESLAQSAYTLRYKITTDTVWTTLAKTTTTSQFRDIAGGTFAAGNYEWQVQTFDSGGLASPWSASEFFTAGDVPPGPTITTPAANSTVSTDVGVVAWSYPTQESYQVQQVADNAGAIDTATVYYDSLQVNSTTARNHPVSYPVQPRYEWVRVRIMEGGLWSAWVNHRILVSYATPPVATLAPYGDPERAAIIIPIATAPDNLLTEAAASFEDGTVGGWSGSSGTTVANSTAQARDGTFSLAVTAGTTAMTGVGLVAYSGYIVTVEEKTYTLLFDAYLGVATPVRPTIQWDNAAGTATVAYTQGVTQTLEAGWHRLVVTGVCPAGAANARAELDAQLAASQVVHLDAVMVHEGDVAVPFHTPNTNLKHVDVIRRMVGTFGEGDRLVTGLGQDPTYVDYTSASGVEYEYEAVVHALNGTRSVSEWTV